MSLGTRFVHGIYLFTAITALLLAVLFIYYGGIVLLWPCLVFIPALRAMWRRIAGGTVIPAELVSERPIVASIVTLASVFALFFKVIFAIAAIDIALAPEWPEEAKKVVIFVVAALFFDVIALLCGEVALVGNGESDATRAARSGPFS